MIQRLARVVIVAVLFVVGAANPASAHSVGKAVPTNYDCILRDVSPNVPGIDLRLIELGERVELTNHTSTEVVVVGYENEPYLRVGPEGTFANTTSPAYYLNRSNDQNNPVPPEADATKPPTWQKLNGDQTIRWHDHRIHWMASMDPPQVRSNPDKRHVVIPDWKFTVLHGQTPIVATGDLVWEPPPSATPWWVLAVATAVCAGLLAKFPRRRVVVAVLVGLIAVDIFHTVGLAFATPGGLLSLLGTALESSLVSFVAWLVGGYGAFVLWKGRNEGLWFATFATAVVFVIGGLSDVGSLSKSQLPFAWSPELGRACVSLSLGVGMGLLLAFGAQIRRERQPLLPPSVPLQNETEN